MAWNNRLTSSFCHHYQSLCCFGGMVLTHLSSRFSVHAHRTICCNLSNSPFSTCWELHTRHKLWSHEHFSLFFFAPPQVTASMHFEAWNNLIWSLALRVKRVNKTRRHGVPSPPRVAKRSLPGAPHIATNLLSWSFSFFSLSCLTRSF